MSTTLSLTYVSTINVVETLGDTDLATTDKTITHSGRSSQGTFAAGTTPTISKRAGFSQAGSGTIDLRALVGTNAGAIDGNGLKVQFMKVQNPVTNANVITIAMGGSNGYDGFGASFSLTLSPGAEVLIKNYSGGSAIGASNKTLDVTATGVQPLLGEIVMG